ncbi:MAG: hypothetical protein AAGB28_14415 [Pseudomonadota bacterium]
MVFEHAYAAICSKISNAFNMFEWADLIANPAIASSMCRFLAESLLKKGQTRLESATKAALNSIRFSGKARI